MTEHIGKVKIDYTHYCGRDLYCDGDIEDELFDIAKNSNENDFNEIIRESKSWPIFYHLSSQRQNIVEWLPMDKSTKVLEVGSGCGAITGMLASKAGSVTSIDLSRKRSEINAYRNKNYDNITIQVGNFKDIEPTLENDYDYVLLIGVFEYAQGYMGSDNPYVDFMNILKKHVATNGRLVIAIENQFGLKYWAGCKEDHLGIYFSGLEGYKEDSGVKTFTKKGLEKILKEVKVEEYQCYYPYPDYKFMTSLYSDNYLPNIGELNSNQNSFDRDRIEIFDENSVFDTIIEADYFGDFSNSFMIVVGPKIDIAYVKYSNERDDKYKIATEIISDSDSYQVVKRALKDGANEHINNMKLAYELLIQKYTKLSFNKIISYKNKELSSIEFEYIKGDNLSKRFDAYLQKRDADGYLNLFNEYIDKISYVNNSNISISNIDFIFANIIIDRDGKWNTIDYEWTKNENISVGKCAYRAYYLYCVEKNRRFNDEHLEADSLYLDDKSVFISGESIRKILNLSIEEAKQIRDDEIIFQKGVVNNELTKAEMLINIGNPVYSIERVKAVKNETVMVAQIYENTGKGFNEEESILVKKVIDGQNIVEYSLSQDVKVLRFDPCMCKCIVSIDSIKWNGSENKFLYTLMKTNGKKLGNNRYFFDTKDPNITLPIRLLKGSKEKDVTNYIVIEFSLYSVQEK